MPPAPLLPFLCQAVWAPHSLGNTGLMGTALRAAEHVVPGQGVVWGLT